MSRHLQLNVTNTKGGPCRLLFASQVATLSHQRVNGEEDVINARSRTNREV